MTKEEIINLTEKFYITKYKINDDMSIDVFEDVNIYRLGLENIPLKFRYITGNFYCSENKITSLKNCPQHVTGDFFCNHNKLASLEGCPNYVGVHFGCEYNQLTSLEHGPNYVGGLFNCSSNRLTDLFVNPIYIGENLFVYEKTKPSTTRLNIGKVNCYRECVIQKSQSPSPIFPAKYLFYLIIVNASNKNREFLKKI